MLTDKANLATVEDSTAVNVRLLKKALTPPITITNFFKPSSKTNDPGVSTVENDCSTIYAKFNDNLNDQSIVLEEAETSSCGTASQNRKTASPYFVNQSKTKSSTKCESKLKRAAEDNLSRKDSAKRCKKQGNILSSLKNSSRQQEKRECPICKITFGATASNKEINDHMDDCLIE